MVLLLFHFTYLMWLQGLLDHRHSQAVPEYLRKKNSLSFQSQLQGTSCGCSIWEDTSSFTEQKTLQGEKQRHQPQLLVLFREKSGKSTFQDTKLWYFTPYPKRLAKNPEICLWTQCLWINERAKRRAMVKVRDDQRLNLWCNCWTHTHQINWKYTQKMMVYIDYQHDWIKKHPRG